MNYSLKTFILYLIFGFLSFLVGWHLKPSKIIQKIIYEAPSDKQCYDKPLDFTKLCDNLYEDKAKDILSEKQRILLEKEENLITNESAQRKALQAYEDGYRDGLKKSQELY